MITTARREGDNIIITVPVDEAQSLRVALQPCQCGHPKSTKTAAIRAKFVKGIGMAMFQKPQSSTQVKGSQNGI